MSMLNEFKIPVYVFLNFQSFQMKLQGDKTGRKGHLSVATEVFEVAPSLHMVELRKTGGDTLEFHKFYKSFSSGLKDIMWNSEENTEGLKSQQES
nr:CBL-interacting protein kinase 9-like [Quercus suber]POF24593.1 cbl-interacting protein kinase 9 [Quercus suber]